MAGLAWLVGKSGLFGVAGRVEEACQELGAGTEWGLEVVLPPPWSSQTLSDRGLLENLGQGIHSLFYAPPLVGLAEDGALTGSAHDFC